MAFLTEERLSKNELTALFERQQAFAPRIAATGFKERKAKLQRMLDYLLVRGSDFEDALYKDMKKPPAESHLSEVLPLTSEIRYHLKHLRRWMRPQAVPTPLAHTGTSSFIQYEAKGTSLILSPWNYPISLALKPLISAVSAGCTAIIKPSEFTPHAATFIRGFVSNLFDPTEVAVVEGGPDVATDLLSLPFDHIFFTGSPAIGKVVMRAAANHLSSVSLELGGKSPAIIDETAALPAAAQQIAWAKFLNNGQTCIAPDYLLIHHSVQDRFLTELTTSIKRLYNPENKGFVKSSDYGRIIHQRHFERLQSLYQDAIEKGAVNLHGGTFIKDDLFIEPTVLTHVAGTMAVMQEEIFGPILPVVVYNEIDEAIELVNKMEKPLALYIHSRNAHRIDHILKHTSSGNALVNELLMQFQHPEIPFGGIKNSGMGKANGFFGFQAFSNPKGVIKRQFGTLKFLYPPFTPGKLKLLRILQKFV